MPTYSEFNFSHFKIYFLLFIHLLDSARFFVFRKFLFYCIFNKSLLQNELQKII